MSSVTFQMKAEGSAGSAIPLKMRILKPEMLGKEEKKDASIYDFDAEEKKDDIPASPIGLKTSSSLVGSPSKSPISGHPLSPRVRIFCFCLKFYIKC